jgi:serine phosphatase RsbU (regulator of sigma subunit)
VEGVDVGGDWYDLIALDDHRLLLVVGDVSGRGVRAAATMASLRFAIHAYAAEEDPPDTILTKLSKLVDVNTSGQLATILCALVDVQAHRMTVTSAGHLPPLLISDGSGTFVRSEVGVPIGVSAGVRYTSTSLDTPERPLCLHSPMVWWKEEARASTEAWRACNARRARTTPRSTSSSTV